ncbi:MAG: hypothetical protein U5J63_01365 [Fodinibius sp.]|nr:hypothetical protein [Fodinibius sp.]
MIGIFSLWGINANSIWIQAGCAVIVLSAAFIWYKLKNTQRLSFDANSGQDRPMREHLNSELESLQKQKALLANVAWWYLTPIWIGLLLITIGFSNGPIFKIGYMIAVSLLYAWIWNRNQKVVKQRFDPLETEIKEAIKSIDNE